MKRKLIIAIAALVCSVGMQKVHAAAADYLTGWTEVTSLPTSSDIDNYYYVFVATEADLMVAEEVNSTQNSRLAPVYRTPTSPLAGKRFVWMLTYDADHGYGIKNLGYNTYFLQTNTDSPWQIHAYYETSLSTADWTKWTFAYDAGSWTIRNGKYPTFSDKDCYWGPWNSKAFKNGEPMAGNKAGDEIGKFKIYQILRSSYNTLVTNQVVTNTYITNPSFESNGAVQAERSNNCAATGWTFDWSGHTNSNAVNSVDTKGTKRASIGDNVEASDGTYFMGIRLRWDEKTYTANTSQELTLPKGSYLLYADYRAWTKQSSATLTLAVLSNGGTLSTTNGNMIASASSFNDPGFETFTLPFTTSSSPVTIKFTLNGKQNTQAIYDNINLIYTANYTEALQSAIDRATALNTRSETSALTTAISAAQSVLDGVTNVASYQTTIDGAVDELNEAISTAWSTLKSNLASGEDITYVVENAGFESSTPVSGSVVTAIKDAYANNTYLGNMQAVGGWTIVANGDNHASGVYAYGGTPWLGGSGYTAPATDPEGNAGKALGIIAVWTATSQYKQNVTLPAGRYVITLPIYNKTGGTSAFSKNLFGFIENGGTEHLATAKTYTVDSWTTETVQFDLNSETSGYLSLGYTAVNSGSGAMPHLFVDGLTITYTSASNAYAATHASALSIYNDAAYANVTGNEKTDLKALLDADASGYTVAEYFEAVGNINTAVAAFTAAKEDYDQYAEAAAVATTISATSVLAPTTAAEAAAAAQELNVNIDTKVTATYTYDVTDILAGSFTGTLVSTNNNQHWSEKTVSYLDNYGTGDLSASQTLSLPAGEYILKMAGRGATSANAVTISAAGQTLHFKRKGDSGRGITKAGVANFAEADDTYANSNNGRGWEWRFIPLSLGSATDVTVTLTLARPASGSTWGSFSDFTILTSSTDADEADYTALKDAISTAEGHTLGFGDGEYAPYKNADALTKLATAKAIDQEATNAKAVVNGVTTALVAANTSGWTANADDVNAIYNGDFSAGYWSGNTWYPEGWKVVSGWSATVEDAQSSTGHGDYKQPGSIQYGSQGIYTMPLAASQLYKLTFKYGYMDQNATPTISVLNGSSEGLSETACETVYSGSNYKTAIITQTMYFTTGAAGNYTLNMKTDKNIVFSDVSLVKADAAETTLSSGTVANNTFYQELTLGGRTFSNEKWNTLCVPFAFPKSTFAEVKVLNGITVTDDHVSMAFADASSTVAAGTPCLVKALAADYSLVLKNVNVKAATTAASTAKADGTPETTVTYVGTFTSTDLGAGDNAWIVKDNLLHEVVNDGTVGAYRAYFTVETAAEVKALTFDFNDTPTAINAVEATQNEKAEIFNLAGQRLNKAQKGVNIINGKKVLVK